MLEEIAEQTLNAIFDGKLLKEIRMHPEDWKQIKELIFQEQPIIRFEYLGIPVIVDNTVKKGSVRLIWTHATKAE